MTPWTVAHETLLSMGFPRQEFWSRLPFLSPGDLQYPRINPASPALTGNFLTPEPPGEPIMNSYLYSNKMYRICMDRQGIVGLGILISAMSSQPSAFYFRISLLFQNVILKYW